MFQNLLKLLVSLSKYDILKIKVIFLYFKRKYVTRDQNKLSNRCNFCSSKARHKIYSAEYLETTYLTTLLNLNKL